MHWDRWQCKANKAERIAAMHNVCAMRTDHQFCSSIAIELFLLCIVRMLYYSIWSFAWWLFYSANLLFLPFHKNMARERERARKAKKVHNSTLASHSFWNVCHIQFKRLQMITIAIISRFGLLPWFRRPIQNLCVSVHELKWNNNNYLLKHEKTAIR